MNIYIHIKDTEQYIFFSSFLLWRAFLRTICRRSGPATKQTTRQLCRVIFSPAHHYLDHPLDKSTVCHLISFLFVILILLNIILSLCKYIKVYIYIFASLFLCPAGTINHFASLCSSCPNTSTMRSLFRPGLPRAPTYIHIQIPRV